MRLEGTARSCDRSAGRRTLLGRRVRDGVRGGKRCAGASERAGPGPCGRCCRRDPRYRLVRAASAAMADRYCDLRPPMGQFRLSMVVVGTWATDTRDLSAACGRSAPHPVAGRRRRRAAPPPRGASGIWAAWRGEPGTRSRGVASDHQDRDLPLTCGRQVPPSPITASSDHRLRCARGGQPAQAATGKIGIGAQVCVPRTHRDRTAVVADLTMKPAPVGAPYPTRTESPRGDRPGLARVSSVRLDLAPERGGRVGTTTEPRGHLGGRPRRAGTPDPDATLLSGATRLAVVPLRPARHGLRMAALCADPGCAPTCGARRPRPRG